MAFHLYSLLVDLLRFGYAKVFLLIVRMRGIEPPTSSSQATRSNLLSYILIMQVGDQPLKRDLLLL